MLAAAATTVLVSGCARGSGGAIVSRSDAECPPAPDEKPYTISVSNHAGDSVSAEARQAIANALASEWGRKPDDGPRPPSFYEALRELSAYVPNPRRYGLGEWRVRAGDTAVAVLTYQGGRTARIDVQSEVGPELRERIAKMTAAALTTAAKGQAVRDTMPLVIFASGGADVRLEIRLGWTQPPGAAVATFALRERQPRLRAGFGTLIYPDEYRARNIEGSVLAAFIMTDQGFVDGQSVRFISSDGNAFTKNVAEYLERVRFDPYTLDCVALPVATGQQFNFVLRRYGRPSG